MTTTNYPLGDFLIRIKNQVLAKGTEVRVAKTNMVLAVAEALKTLGFIREITEENGEVVVLLSYRRKEPVLMNVHLISKPGLRVYMSADELSKKKGPTIYLVSTPKGIKDSKTAVKERLGGEVIAEFM
jgi:small subunit ribosomal protein S8